MGLLSLTDLDILMFRILTLIRYLMVVSISSLYGLSYEGFYQGGVSLNDLPFIECDFLLTRRNLLGK
jgi:hypothetical protein